jgi:sodium/bile acid cotransporter 7
MYPTASDLVRASVQIPVILYTAEQIFIGQFMVWYFKRWLARDKAKKAQQELEMNSEVAVSEGEGVPRDEAKGREGEKI